MRRLVAVAAAVALTGCTMASGPWRTGSRNFRPQRSEEVVVGHRFTPEVARESNELVLRQQASALCRDAKHGRFVLRQYRNTKPSPVWILGIVAGAVVAGVGVFADLPVYASIPMSAGGGLLGTFSYLAMKKRTPSRNRERPAGNGTRWGSWQAVPCQGATTRATPPGHYPGVSIDVRLADGKRIRLTSKPNSRGAIKIGRSLLADIEAAAHYCGGQYRAEFSIGPQKTNNPPAFTRNLHRVEIAGGARYQRTPRGSPLRPEQVRDANVRKHAVSCANRTHEQCADKTVRDAQRRCEQQCITEASIDVCLDERNDCRELDAGEGLINCDAEYNACLGIVGSSRSQVDQCVSGCATRAAQQACKR